MKGTSAFALLSLAAGLFLSSNVAIADPAGVCVMYCDGGSPPPPAGPSARELREQHEAKDLREAADDAMDKGVDAYERGNYEEALRRFQEALDYEPDDPAIQANVQRTEKKLAEARAARDLRLRDSEAIRQLTSAAQHSGAAKETADKPESGMVFDTNGGRGPALPDGVRAGGAGEQSSDPQVPPSRRTSAITAMEQERQSVRTAIRALDDKMKDLDPAKSSVEIAHLKQEKSNAEAKVRYLNFSISETLKKPDAEAKK